MGTFFVQVVEVIGVRRTSRLPKTRKAGQRSREHDLLGEFIMTLATWAGINKGLRLSQVLGLTVG